MQLISVTPNDLAMLARHKIHHMNENGREGDIIFAPIEDVPAAKEETDLKRDAEALAKPVTEAGWMRLWAVTDGKEIYGDLTLTHRPPLKTSLHRCLLMMGLQRSIRGQGWGAKLMQEAIDWAKQQPTLDWISLNVFENNPRAKALYTKFGFESVGTTKDLFRVFGQSIDDTQMDLRLR